MRGSGRRTLLFAVSLRPPPTPVLVGYHEWDCHPLRQDPSMQWNLTSLKELPSHIILSERSHGNHPLALDVGYIDTARVLPSLTETNLME